MQAVVFDPLLPLPLIAVLAAVALVGVAVALWRGLTGWWLRGLAALVLLAALAGPSLRQEDRARVPNIAIVVLDDSASNRIGDRGGQLAAALAGLEAELGRLGETRGLEVHEVHVADGGENGTLLVSALAEATAELPADRIAGAIVVTDGQVHDADALDAFPGPVQVLLTGSAEDWDRRVVVETAPAFAIVDEPVSLSLRVEDLGAAPGGGGYVPLLISLDGTEPLRFEVPVNRSVELPVTLQRGGVNVLQVSTPPAAGELTDRNNAAIVSINGVRDRLRVLLVSGEPYPGERTCATRYHRNQPRSPSNVESTARTVGRRTASAALSRAAAFAAFELIGQATSSGSPTGRRETLSSRLRTSERSSETATQARTPSSAITTQPGIPKLHVFSATSSLSRKLDGAAVPASLAEAEMPKVQAGLHIREPEITRLIQRTEFARVSACILVTGRQDSNLRPTVWRPPASSGRIGLATRDRLGARPCAPLTTRASRRSQPTSRAGPRRLRAEPRRDWARR